MCSFLFIDLFIIDSQNEKANVRHLWAYASVKAFRLDLFLTFFFVIF